MSKLTRRLIPVEYSEPSVKLRPLETTIARALRASDCFALDDLRGQFVRFDLSHSYWYDLGALLWLVSLLHKLRRNGNEVQLLFPEPDDPKSQNLWHFLNRWGLFPALRECVDDPVNLLIPEQLPHTQIPTKYAPAAGVDEHGAETALHTLRVLEITTILDRPHPAEKGPDPDTAPADPFRAFLAKYHDQIIIQALSSLCGWDPPKTKQFVRQVLEEGVRNALLHGRGTFLTVAMRLDARNLTLAVCDNGLGIPVVLRQAFEAMGRGEMSRLSDVELIQYFTEPELILDSQLIEISTRRGVTSKPQHQGMGLYYLKSLILSEGGELRVRSGRAQVDFIGKEITASDELLTSPGTLFRVVTPLKR